MFVLRFGIFFCVLMISQPCLSFEKLPPEEMSIVEEFIKNICTGVPLEFKENQLKLSGTAKAELDNMFKKIADLGFNGNKTSEAYAFKEVIR
ncbi:MAG: hypothetical protein PVI90_14425 [Desulfobacteraceae bacterium]|jgi:hypothetical protein